MTATIPMSGLPGIAPAIRLEIENRLTSIAREEGVRLLLAVESGSRAWGFPSPDSDYDVRFLYLRPRRDYLALSSPRDVIERPIVDEIDLSGWDIRKALGLLLRHNAVLSEWLDSPIRYRMDDLSVERIRGIADRYFNPRGYALHYASLGRGSVERWLDKEDEVPVKRYFYALRPALAIRALRLDPSRRPPMNMRALIDKAELGHGLIDQIDTLIARKALTKEAGRTIRLPDVERLVRDELDRTDEVPERLNQTGFSQATDSLFLNLVDEG